MARLFSFAMALLLGLLAVFLLDLALGASETLAQERKNCPAGFVWIRWSPNGCSQEMLPAHGKIGYDGYGICEEGYQGIYERRETTDGKSAPGSPYTNFPYLLQCVTPQEFAALEAAGKLPGQTAAGGRGASPRDLATAGLVAGAAALAAAGGWIRGGWGLAPRGLSPQEIARLEELAKRLAELDRKIAEALKEEEAAKKAFYELLNKRNKIVELRDRFRLMEDHLRARKYAEWKNAFRADLQDDALALAGAAATLAGILAGLGFAGAAALQGQLLVTSMFAGWLPGTTALTTAKAESWLGWQADNLPGIFGKLPIGGRGESWRKLQDLSKRMLKSVEACRAEAEAGILSLEKGIPDAEARWHKASRIAHELYEERQRLYSTYQADKAYFQATAEHKQFMDRIYQENRWSGGS
jgi:hypothetical protein